MKFSRLVFLFQLALVLQLSQTAFSQTQISELRNSLQKVIDTSGGTLGIGIMGLNFNESLIINRNTHFPMQSVYKLPLAIAVLDKVDKGMLSLGQLVHIPKGSLDPNTWGPLLRDFPNRDFDITLASLLRYAVSISDNNACDILFRLAGGTAVVNKYIHGIGVKDIAIAATEAEMKKAWAVQYTNWCEPAAILQLLRILYEGRLLSKASNDLLLKLMTESENSPNRLKGLLPANTPVAHKTGTSNTNGKGITAATNDVGIITLPDGRQYAIVVCFSNYTGGVSRGERIIAEISKLSFDYFRSK